MDNQQGIHIIQHLRRRWVLYQLLIHSLIALAVALLIGHALHTAFDLSLGWILLLFAAILAGLILWRNPWHITDKKVTCFLNRQYSELEESSSLLLQLPQQLTLLERLQQRKVTGILQNLSVGVTPFSRQLLYAWAGFAVAIVLSLIIVHLPFKSTYVSHDSKAITHLPAVPKENVLPQIEVVTIKVSPPVYTRKPSRQQDKFTLTIEDGALVKWQLNTNVSAHQAYLLFNGKTRLPLHPGSNKRTQWSAQTILSGAGFYQVGIDNKLSDLYQIQIIKDAPPVIHIKTPKPYTYIDAGETPKVKMQAQVSDDYGIADATLIATVAKGNGEGVKFKEYRMPFAGPLGKQRQLQKLFDLPALQMEPGDELYFYLQAQDNHKQQSRTDVYKVTLQDTAQLLSMDGLVSGSNLKPEFFRSQRQIIMDTESLLKAKDSISANEFNNRCNSIATDQKLLRLRYGKFLGEEDEGKIGEAEGSDLGNVENFNNAAKIMDAYTDKHDNAEDATFFEPAIKAQLKATLNEMWRAELQLRLYKPNPALPYEYKALRLLKDLQQKSRAYVAKTNYNPPPIKAEKRLSGDLSKIGNPASQSMQKAPADAAVTVKQAIDVLIQLHDRAALTMHEKQVLQTVSPQVNRYAAAQGGKYLQTVTALRRLLNNSKVASADAIKVETVLQQMLPPIKTLPHQNASIADMNLGKSYYQHLNRMNR